MELETIKGLARKLSAMMDPASGATANERSVAAAKLRALLARHGLTEEQIQDATRYTFTFILEDTDQLGLLVQVAAMILETKNVRYDGRRRQVDQYSRAGKLLRRKGVQLIIYLHDITIVEHEDIAACFDHYRRLLEALKQSLKADAARIKKQQKLALSATCHRYNIFPPSNGESKKQLSPEEIRAIRAAMSGLSGDAWQRPAGRIDANQLLIA